MRTQYIVIGLVILVALALLYLFLNMRTDDVILKNEKIVAFGDSLVTGYGASGGNDFVSVLERSLDRDIENRGVSGETSGEGRARIKEILAEDPGLVMVLFGGNDALRRVPISETRANLAAIIEALKENGTVVLLLGIQGGILGDPYEDMFQSLAHEYNVALVPNVLESIISDKSLMSDQIHPNDAGYAKIALRVEAALRDILD